MIAYDPNVRLNVEPDLQRWRDALDWMLTRATLLKISDEDLQLLRPGESAEAFAATALQSGVKLVVVTRGAAGAAAWTAQARADVSSEPVQVIEPSAPATRSRRHC